MWVEFISLIIHHDRLCQLYDLLAGYKMLLKQDDVIPNVNGKMEMILQHLGGKKLVASNNLSVSSLVVLTIK